MTKLVRDLMHEGLLTCKPETSLGQLAILLSEYHVHSLIVEDPDGHHIGIITDYDLLAGEWLSADPESLVVMRSLTAGDLMSTPIDSIEADVPAAEAATRMKERVIRRLLVTEDGNPVGIISVSDFIADLAMQAPQIGNTVADIMSDAMLVCRENTPVWAAAKAMTDTRWRSVVVVDAIGRPLGVFSGIDLLGYCEEGADCEATVSEVMHQALTIHKSASIREAANLMIEQHHHRLLVIDPDSPEAMPLGVISSFDIVAFMANPGSIWTQ
jgi:CBS domain-containing protein